VTANCRLGETARREGPLVRWPALESKPSRADLAALLISTIDRATPRLNDYTLVFERTPAVRSSIAYPVYPSGAQADRICGRFSKMDKK
jgi:hypothetical protein